MKWAVADFETTVYEGQTSTEVWSAGFMEEKGNPEVYTSIEAFFSRLECLSENTTIFFHNLKFDGSFIIPFLFKSGYKLGYDETKNKFKKNSALKKKEFRCHINRKGIWYNIIVRLKTGVLVSFYDSYKIIPFSLEDAGKSFNTEHRKLTMEYVGFRHAGGYITPEERKYQENDLYVLWECIEAVLEEGIDKTTIGSTCLSFFKKLYGWKEYQIDFPDLYSIDIDNEFESVGKYILRSYAGAYIYIKEGMENNIVRNGITIDATSLYPSVMHSKSGFVYPYGRPAFSKGKAIENKYTYYFQRIRCRFTVKENYLPFIRIRGNAEYSPRKIQKTNRYTIKGITVDKEVELVLCKEELKLFFEHYNVYDLQYIDYVLFNAREGIFDEYVDIWIERKETAENIIKRTISKLFLNNLYGKFAASIDSSFHLPFIGDDKKLHFTPVLEEEAKAGYIAIGSAIIAHARITDVRACQANYNNFIYTDTDSLHLTCTINEVKGVVIDKHKLCTFKHETSWKYGIFNNVKRYIEVVNEENGEECEQKYNVTCAGMVKAGKKLLSCALEYSDTDSKYYHDINKCMKKYGVKQLNEIERDFIKSGITLNDFRQGLEVPKGKLKAKRIDGGTVLYEGEFTIL